MNDVAVWKELTDYSRSFRVIAFALNRAADEGGTIEALGRALYQREAGIDALAADRTVVALAALYCVKLGITPRDFFENAFAASPSAEDWTALLREWTA